MQDPVETGSGTDEPSGAAAAPAPGAPSGTAAPHPEEMRGEVTVSLFDMATMTASGRTTPAGLISAALLMGVIMLPILWMVRRRR
jgi:hypothetical protein